MLIASYNAKNTGDALVVVVGADQADQKVEIHDNVARILNAKTNLTTGYNFLKASEILPEISNFNGQVDLNEGQVKLLNAYLEEHDFTPDIKLDTQAKFVIGLVEQVEDHPNANRLKITKVLIDHEQELQIVSGSPNMAENIKVVVAKVGAMMPDGLMIFPSELRGIESYGMMCSGRELRIPGAPQKPGVFILPDEFKVGEPFDFSTAQHIFS